jgi:PAS domain S-box-containing protein
MKIWMTFNILSVFLFVIFGNFVFYLNVKNKINRLFFAACLLTAYFRFAEFMALQAKDAVTASFWLRTDGLWPFVLPLLFVFVLLFTEKEHLLRKKLNYFLIFSPSLLISGMTFFTNWFTVTSHNAWGYVRGVMGGIMPVYIAVYAWSIIMTLACIVFCAAYYIKTPDKRKKQQVMLIIAGFALQLIVSSVFNGLMPILNIELPDITVISSLIMIALMTYAVWKLNLFDINSEETAGKILDNMLDFLILADKEGKIIKVNRSICDSLGYGEGELNGKHFCDLLKNKDNYFGTNGAVTDANICRRKETVFLSKTGRELSVVYNVSPVNNAAGELNAYLYICLDISERKYLIKNLKNTVRELAEMNLELESGRDKLRKSYEKLQDVDRTKNNFLSMISHELRTPLTSIMGSNALMLKGIAGKPAPGQVDFLRIIHNNSERLLNLIDELLDISRIENGTLVMHKAPVVINEVIKRSLNDISNASADRRISVGIDGSSDTVLLEADSGRIGQVIINLVNNAVKFSPDGSALTIVVRFVTGPDAILPEYLKNILPADGSYVFVLVKDQGRGIPEEFRSKVFDRFFQVEEINGKRHAGMGLGLAISKDIIAGHGGVIWVESGEGGTGSNFCFLLPVQTQNSQAV